MKGLYNAFCIGILLLCISCSDPLRTGTDLDSDAEIVFSPAIPEVSLETKADLYNSSNLISNGSGSFSVIAYKTGLNGEENLYFKDFNKVLYFSDTDAWRFHNEEDNSFYKRYWPSYAIDFLAYMPYNLANTGVTVTKETQTIECTLPTTVAAQQTAKEFVYAFTANQSYSELTNGIVNLNFIHPFSAINIELGQAHGNTYIDRVEIRNITNKGSFTINQNTDTQEELSYNDWTLTSDTSRQTINIPVNKTVGESINTNTRLGGPFLIVPQLCDEIILYVEFTWNSSTTKAEINLKTSELSALNPGRIYTLTLNLGESKEDITTNVTITDWIHVGYKNDIDIE